MGCFTRHPRVSPETADIHQKQQNQARCDPMNVESTTRQGAAGPAAEIQCSRPADYTQTPTGQGYVKQRHINKKISVCFPEGLSSAVSLQNRQLRTTLRAIKLQANSETVKVSPQARQKHSRYDSHTKELPQLLPKQLVRLHDLSTKMWSIPGEFIQKAETPNSYVVKTPEGVLRRNWIHIKKAAMPGPQVPTKQAPAPMAPKQPIFKIIQPAKTTEISRTAAKPPSIQPTDLEKPRVAAIPPSEPQPLLPPPVTPPPPSIPSVSVTEPHPVSQENDRPPNPIGSGNNNKAIPKVSVSRPPGPVQVPDKP